MNNYQGYGKWKHFMFFCMALGIFKRKLFQQMHFIVFYFINTFPEDSGKLYEGSSPGVIA